MNLKLNIVKMSNEDVIATSGYGCSLTQYGDSEKLTESGGIYHIGAWENTGGVYFNFNGQTPKVGTHYHYVNMGGGEIVLTECDNPNHYASD